jgi:hypothetical protein
MPARRREWHILQAAKQEATLAVDLYNRPAQDRSLAISTCRTGYDPNSWIEVGVRSVAYPPVC